MDEAELVRMVAEAVAAHDDRTTWGEELLANAETIATLLVAAVAGVAIVVKGFHSLDKRVQSVEDYRISHEAADKAAHSALERETSHVVTELQDFRRESTDQHKDLDGKVTAMARDLNQLVGFHQANQGKEKT